MSAVNFDVCSIDFIMYLLSGVPLSIFVLIRDYCTPFSLDGFPNATTLLSLSFKKFIVAKLFWLHFCAPKTKSTSQARIKPAIFVNFRLEPEPKSPARLITLFEVVLKIVSLKWQPPMSMQFWSRTRKVIITLLSIFCGMALISSVVAAFRCSKVDGRCS